MRYDRAENLLRSKTRLLSRHFLDCTDHSQGHHHTQSYSILRKIVSKNRNSLQFHIALSIVKRCKRAAAIRKPRGTSFPRERYIFRRNLQKKLPQQFFLLLTHSNDGPQYVTQQYVRIVRIIQNII